VELASTARLAPDALHRTALSQFGDVQSEAADAADAGRRMIGLVVVLAQLAAATVDAWSVSDPDGAAGWLSEVAARGVERAVDGG
jgi:hypothetical protein